MQLRQRQRQVVDYTIEFHTIATDSGWNNPALIHAFVNGLSDPFKDHLAPLDLPGNLETLVAMVVHVGAD